MKLVEIKKYEVVDESGKAIALFHSKKDAERFIKSFEPSKPVKQSPEEELIEALKGIGMTVSAPKKVDGVGKYWVLTQNGLKAHLWHCGARGWTIDHPTQHDESKRSQAWSDIFDFDVVEFADCNGIELEH